MNQNGQGFSDLENETVECISGHDRLVDLKVVVTMLGVCARTVHRLVAAGELPPPAKVGRASRWFMSEINGYMDRLKQARPKAFVPVQAGGVA